MMTQAMNDHETKTNNTTKTMGQKLSDGFVDWIKGEVACGSKFAQDFTKARENADAFRLSELMEEAANHFAQMCADAITAKGK